MWTRYKLEYVSELSSTISGPRSQQAVVYN